VNRPAVVGGSSQGSGALEVMAESHRGADRTRVLVLRRITTTIPYFLEPSIVVRELELCTGEKYEDLLE